MIRIVFENILLFLLPTLLYLAYMLLMRETTGTDASANAPRTPMSVLNDAPLLYLFAAGVALVLVTLIAFGSTSGGKPNQPYTPPAMKDGQIQPGHIE